MLASVCASVESLECVWETDCKVFWMLMSRDWKCLLEIQVVSLSKGPYGNLHSCLGKSLFWDQTIIILNLNVDVLTEMSMDLLGRNPRAKFITTFCFFWRLWNDARNCLFLEKRQVCAWAIAHLCSLRLDQKPQADEATPLDIQVCLLSTHTGGQTVNRIQGLLYKLSLPNLRIRDLKCLEIQILLNTDMTVKFQISEHFEFQIISLGILKLIKSMQKKKKKTLKISEMCNTSVPSISSEGSSTQFRLHRS
jgi:hypothetical protein